MKMTQKQRIMAQIQHQETDYVPYTLAIEKCVGEQLDAYYNSTSWRGLLDSSIHLLTWPSKGILVDEEIEGEYIDIYGTAWRLDARPYHILTPAMPNASFEHYHLPDIRSCFDPDWELRASQFIQEHPDHFVVGYIGFGLFERSWTLRGFDNALVDSVINPGFYEELIEELCQHQMGLVERILHLPVDGMFFSDDWGYQRGVLLGAKRWRQFLKPRLARMYTQVHTAGKTVLTHCCGSIAEIIPDLIEIGLDVLESVQPEADGMNPYELKRLYGKHLTFWGGLGSQSTIPFGTPDEIKAEITRLSREMGHAGGYILAPAKELQPETPVENAAAVVEGFLRNSGVSFP